MKKIFLLILCACNLFGAQAHQPKRLKIDAPAPVIETDGSAALAAVVTKLQQKYNKDEKQLISHLRQQDRNQFAQSIPEEGDDELDQKFQLSGNQLQAIKELHSRFTLRSNIKEHLKKKKNKEYIVDQGPLHQIVQDALEPNLVSDVVTLVLQYGDEVKKDDHYVITQTRLRQLLKPLIFTFDYGKIKVYKLDDDGWLKREGRSLATQEIKPKAVYNFVKANAVSIWGATIWNL